MTPSESAHHPDPAAPQPGAPVPSSAWRAAAVVVSLGAFAAFALYRSRFVGGCDPTSYYLESLRFRGVDALHLDLSLPGRDALAPLCTELRGERVVSFFPPGFPLLLAAFGAVGLEFFVTAFFGAVSAFTLFRLSHLAVGPKIALAVTALWLASPLVFFGSTQLMSDMPATALGLLSLLASRSGRSPLSGVLLGASVGVRPTQLLLLPFLVLDAKSASARLRLLAGLGLTLLGWAFFLRLSTGSFVPPYAANRAELSGELLLSQLRFLLGTTAVIHGPVVLLSAIGLGFRFGTTWPLLVWFGLHAGFYGLWRSPLSVWWESRFLLPALPAIYLSAAEGWAHLARVGGAGARAPRAAASAVLVLGYAAWSHSLSPARFMRTQTYAEEYRRDSLRVAKLVPANALVGAVNHSGPLRLYGRVQSFLAWHERAPDLVRFALRTGRPLFVVLTPEERRATSTRVSLPPTRFERVARLPSGRILERVLPLENVKDVGTPDAHPFLLEGFGGDEGSPSLSFVWVEGHRAVLGLPPAPASGGQQLSLHVCPFAALGRRQELSVSAAGQHLASFPLLAGFQTVHVQIPAELAADRVELTFTLASSPASLGQGVDPRPLAASIDWIAFSDLP